MRAGPLRRMIAGFGLIALLPIAWMVINGDLAPAAAGIRAGIVLGVVLVVGRLADLVLSAAAHSFERQALAAARSVAASEPDERAESRGG